MPKGLGLVSALVLGLLAQPAAAQTNYLGFFQPVPSTPNISVTATATTGVVVPAGQNGSAGQAKFVAIKNDCGSPLHFDLNYIPTSGTQHYPIRLNGGESFSAPFQISTVAASPASGNAVTCTITVMFGR